MPIEIRVPFQKGLRLIANFLNTRFPIDLRLISIVRLIATLCETGPCDIGKVSCQKLNPSGSICFFCKILHTRSSYYMRYSGRTWHTLSGGASSGIDPFFGLGGGGGGVKVRKMPTNFGALCAQSRNI